MSEAARGLGTFELPDLLRARAVVLLAASQNNWLAAETCLMSSIDCARKQSALGWELHSTILLSRWWADRGRDDDARNLLAGVYERFTEGFESADLREAKGLLQKLGLRTSHD